MAIVSAFGDESGVMPQRDNDGIFVAAVIATEGRPNPFAWYSGHRDWLIDRLKDLSAVSFVAYVKPYPGYGDALQAKYGKMDVMARLYRLITGSHKFLPQAGLSPHNMTWMHCMSQALSYSILPRVFQVPVERVDIVMDQKSLASESQRLFRALLLRSADRAREILERVRHRNEGEAVVFASNLRFGAKATSVCWSDEAGAAGSEAGLLLAHYLAKHSRKELDRPTRVPLADLMGKAGIKFQMVDITDTITSPIARTTIEMWKRETGLPEPNG